MQALIVYESFFGNARCVAEAVADGLRERADVRLVDAGDADASLDDVDLLVVGGPTHQFGMPRHASRRQAIRQYKAESRSLTGLREWISRLPDQSGLPTAVFDTRLARPAVLRVLDHAGRTSARMLRRHGARIVDTPQAFLVESATGPLADGELDRARAWGRTLAVTAASYDA
jgi:flavodoxin